MIITHKNYEFEMSKINHYNLDDILIKNPGKSNGIEAQHFPSGIQGSKPLKEYLDPVSDPTSDFSDFCFSSTYQSLSPSKLLKRTQGTNKNYVRQI